MIIFIVSHDVVMGIFAKSGARALLMPAGTRFATEVICLGSLRKDKQDVQKLFVDTEVVEWIDKQPAEVKQKYRRNKANALSDEWWHRTEVSCWGGISPSPPPLLPPPHLLPDMYVLICYRQVLRVSYSRAGYV